MATDVGAIYRELLGREADPSGLQTYGSWSPEKVRRSIMASPEYQSRGGGAAAPFDPFAEQRRQIQEDLARQTQAWEADQGQRATQLAWQQEDVNRNIGDINEVRPEMQGRAASSFAARGSYSSGARVEAEGDIDKELSTKVHELKLASQRAGTMAEWETAKSQFEKQTMELQANRQLQDIQRQQDEYQAQMKAGLSSGGGGGRGGGGSAAGGKKYIDPAEAQGFAQVQVQVYRAQGNDLRTAQAKASYDTRQRYPGISNDALFGSAGATAPKATTPKFNVYEVSTKRGLAYGPDKLTSLRSTADYRSARQTVTNWVNDSKSGMSAGKSFEEWMRLKKAQEFLKKAPATYSVALADVLYRR